MQRQTSQIFKGMVFSAGDMVEGNFRHCLCPAVLWRPGCSHTQGRAGVEQLRCLAGERSPAAPGQSRSAVCSEQPALFCRQSPAQHHHSSGYLRPGPAFLSNRTHITPPSNYQSRQVRALSSNKKIKRPALLKSLSRRLEY